MEANRIKSGLERKIQVHKTAVKRAKTIFKAMQVLKKKYLLILDVKIVQVSSLG